MNRITFLSRRAAGALSPAPRSILISIHDNSEDPLDALPGWEDILTLRFHDTDGKSMGLEVFSPDQARQCLEFVSRHPETNELVVHCQMGQSRSASIALFFSELLEVPCFKECYPVSAETYKLYNRKVYAELFAAEYGPPGATLASGI